MLTPKQVMYQFAQRFQESEWEVDISFDEHTLKYEIKSRSQHITGSGEENFLHSLIDFMYDEWWIDRKSDYDGE